MTSSLEGEADCPDTSWRIDPSLLASASHELRAPLNAIIGFSELLYDGQVPADTPEHKEFLKDILTSGRHLLQLVNDLVDLGRVETGQLEYCPQPTLLENVFGAVLFDLRALAAEKRVEIEVEHDPQLDGIVIDTTRLKQIVLRCMASAIEISPPAKRVVLRACCESANAFCIELELSRDVEVPADVAALFSRDARVGRAPAKKYSSSALGLVLVKRLVETQGGSLVVANSERSGAVFRATFPLRSTASTRFPIPRTIVASANAPWALVAVSHLPEQELLIGPLSVLGYSVQTVATGAQALAWCRERTFDAIVLGVGLPDVMGVELLNALRARGKQPEVPALLMASVRGGAAADARALLELLALSGVSPEVPAELLIVTDEPGFAKRISATLAERGYRMSNAVTKRCDADGGIVDSIRAVMESTLREGEAER
jgi:CheY-like chemotaxis protein